MSKTVLITGASSGIGLSHAIYLSSKGYNVIGTSRKAEDLELEQLHEHFLRDNTKYKFTNKEQTEVKPLRTLVPKRIIQNLEDYLEKIKYVTMDLASTESINRAIEEIESLNTINVLINNAAYAYWGSVEEITIEETINLFQVNFFGLLRVLHKIIPRMREMNSGQIINTSSLAGVVGLPFISHYSATKAGMQRITESLRTELAPYKIKVSSLLPGDINTTVDVNMVLRHGKKGKYISTDIGPLIDAIPVPKDSPYYQRSRSVWEIFIRNHIIAPSPLLVSKKIEKIIRSKKPKVHYKVGSKQQVVLLPFLKAILPEGLFLSILAKEFGL